MNAMNLAWLFVCVLAIAVGQILYKLAARTAAGGATFPWEFFNAYFFAAIAVYAAAALLWVWILKSLPLNVAYPFVGLAFILVPLMAAYFLGEALDWRHLAGGALIAAGVAVASWR